jgi:nuclear pore complex protein Nup93
LFSGASTTSRNTTNTTTMSLFANLGQPAASGTSSGGLFGTSTGASNSATPSLFSNLGGGGTPNAQAGTSQATSGGLFSGLGAAKPAGTTAPSLFAGAGSTSQPPAQTGGFSLFSNQQTSQSTTNNAQQTSGLGQSSIFGTASTQQQQPQQQQPQQQQPQQQQQQQGAASLSQANGGASRSAHFDHLLERGRKRNAGENGTSNFDELPSLQLGLGDIARKVRNLGNGGPSADQVQDRAQDRAA